MAVTTMMTTSHGMINDDERKVKRLERFRWAIIGEDGIIRSMQNRGYCTTITLHCVSINSVFSTYKHWFWLFYCKDFVCSQCKANRNFAIPHRTQIFIVVSHHRRKRIIVTPSSSPTTTNSRDQPSSKQIFIILVTKLLVER